MSKPVTATQTEIVTGATDPTYNKANDIRKDNTALGELNIGLQDLDYTIKYYLENIIKPTINDFGSERPVPVVYGSPEKWKNFQQDGYFRDREDKILAPIIAYKRTALAKNRALGNKVDANHPQVYYTQQVKYTPQNRYDQFSKLTNQKPLNTYINTVMADYVDLTYEVVIWTDFVEQMNSIVEAILYSEGSFWGEKERFKFRTKIDSFTNTTDLLQDNERIVRTNFTLTLYGYIVPDVKVKQLSDKLSDVTYSTREAVIESVPVETNTTIPGASKQAIKVFPESAVFEMSLSKPNVSPSDFYLEINGQTVLVSAIKGYRQTYGNTITFDLDIEQLGYTLASSDVITVTGKYIS